MANFSRSGRTSSLGKCTDEVKSLVPEEVKNQLAGLSFVKGLSVSEYVRDLLIEHVYGAVHAVRLRNHAPSTTAGKGRE